MVIGQHEIMEKKREGEEQTHREAEKLDTVRERENRYIQRDTEKGKETYRESSIHNERQRERERQIQRRSDQERERESDQEEGREQEKGRDKYREGKTNKQRQMK